ncbi:Predicted acetyltransferase, GNAT superfamily [Cohnella sp. OV330]|uniref:GNAT family N-acetyltransferase n=1 Tax=Cohnella sp. OV330 TaxID=1855288 RepID=UPI0008EED3F9|nr:GNAT family N-acetyltransferase [Cohnella sp. OV330]SFA72570.1 Predicted acetyltransferase, GNAT superfamily [Cohnella sp. OV330]
MPEQHEDRIQYRLITDIEELVQAVHLQKKVWAPDTITSMQQMRAAILHGGAVNGAFSKEELVGFCYGFIGYDGKAPYVGSHMMALDPAYRDRGIGMRLKLEQRLWALEAGYDKIVWTFDPFESRNAYLNLCKLGATVSSYIREFYGYDAAGHPTDRFLVEWALSSARATDAAEGRGAPAGDAAAYPRLLGVEFTDGKVTALGHQSGKDLIGLADGLRLPIPRAAAQLKQAQPDAFKVWQRQLRELATAAFSQGYRVVSCHRAEPEVQDYVLERQA